MDPKQRSKALRESLESVREGEMPPGAYAFLNPGARLTSRDIGLIRNAVGEPTGSEDHENGDEKERRERDDD